MHTDEGPRLTEVWGNIPNSCIDDMYYRLFILYGIIYILYVDGLYVSRSVGACTNTLIASIRLRISYVLGVGDGR